MSTLPPPADFEPCRQDGTNRMYMDAPFRQTINSQQLAGKDCTRTPAHSDFDCSLGLLSLMGFAG
jgi:hypothetical protein